MASSSLNYKSFNILKTVYIFAVVFAVCLTLISCSPKSDESLKVVAVKFQNVEFKVDVVSTDEGRIKGLGRTDSLGSDRGLLFDFQKEGIYSFWMKDMNYPIDIIWLNSKLNVVHLKHSASPASYPRKFASTTPARYVLEINAGQSKKYQIEIGSKIQLLAG